MEVASFYDPITFTLSYVVHDRATKDAVAIDPVLDYDPLTGKVSTTSVATIDRYIREKELRLRYVFETHAHADHLSGSQYLRRRFDAQLAIGARIAEVQRTFRPIFDLPASFRTDGSQFDRLLEDGEVLAVGSLAIEAIATPGHTPACMSYRIAESVFTGDALFIEDYGTGRCDFPGGNADALYTSVHERLYALPETTRVFVGHDYRPSGRPMRAETTIGREKDANIQLRAHTTRADFVRARNERDAHLEPPRLLFPSIQVDIDAGRLPARHANGRRYLTLPITDDEGID